MGYSLLPADRYKVVNKSLLTDLDRKNIMRFYAPIIGPIAVNLYLNLWLDIKDNTLQSEYQIHNHLFSLLKCNPNSFVEARESLESVGLLKTYVKEENVFIYLYELYSPLSPVEFFNHPILNVVLYNSVGEDEYNRLLKEYEKVKVDYTGFTEITKNMDEVYTSKSYEKVNSLQEKEVGNIQLTSKIDYDLIANSIPKDVRVKLHTETNTSLNLADNLIEILEQKEYEELFLNCHFSIHIDAGHSTYGKTKDLIPELIGWIKACGYDCEVKPDSFAAKLINSLS